MLLQTVSLIFPQLKIVVQRSYWMFHYITNKLLLCSYYLDDEDRDDSFMSMMTRTRDRLPSTLWGLAKRLAVARSRRGKTNWLRAKKKIRYFRRQSQQIAKFIHCFVYSQRSGDRKKSFWFQAKNIVFSDQPAKDKKILKIL